MGEVKYLIDEWQAFIQQIVYLIGRGYSEFCLIPYAIEKEHKYTNIDEKLIKKYQCDLNKNQRYYRKQNSYANHSFLRYKNLAIVLKTKGKQHNKIKGNDVFKDVRTEDISIRISDWITLEIRTKEGAASVYLSQLTYDNIKGTCLEHLERKRFDKMRITFMNLNGLPAWKGIINQRRKLLEELKKSAKKNGYYKQIDFDSFIIKTKRQIYTVFR